MRPLARQSAGRLVDDAQSISSFSSNGSGSSSSGLGPPVSSSETSPSRLYDPSSSHRRSPSSSNMALTATKTSPQLRLPSFAELSERLSYPSQQATASVRQEQANPHEHGHSPKGTMPARVPDPLYQDSSPSRRQTVSSRPTTTHSYDENYHRRASDVHRPPPPRYDVVEDVKSFGPSSYPTPPRQSPEPRRPSATGLTASWLPVDDPGRSSLRSGRVIGGAGGPLQARRATLSGTEGTPQQQGNYSWYPQQPSPGWESAGPGPGPGPGPITSASSSSARYHPFARDGSVSPDYPRSAGPHHDYFNGAVASNVTSSTTSSPASSMSRRRGKLPKDVTELLRSWLMEHANHPYPNEDEKRRLCSLTGLSISQVSNWFINARRRILVPQLQTAAAEQQARAVAHHHQQQQQQQHHYHHHHAAPSSHHNAGHYHQLSVGTSPSATTPINGAPGMVTTPGSHGSHSGSIDHDDYFPPHRAYQRQAPPPPASSSRGPPAHYQQQPPAPHQYYQHPDYSTGRR